MRLRMTDKWPDSQGRFIHKLRHFLLMYKYVVLLSGGVLSITEEARSNDNLLYPWTSDLSALMGSLFSRCITGKKKHVSAYVIKHIHDLTLVYQSTDHDRVKQLSRWLK